MTMSKKFNIHEWQAKQRKQRLDENDDEWQKRQDAQTPGKNPEYFYDKDSIMGKLKKDPDYIKKINAKNAKNEHHAGEYEPDFLKQSVNTFLDKLKEKTNEGPDYETVEKIMEKHFSAKKEVEEMNTTGGGASFNAGAGEGYMTPNAFKKKRKNN
jgi:hypothetical protein